MYAEGDKLYGAQDAARYLGIHRSTLFLSIQRNLIVPDAVTPGGHYRFRRCTLDAFKSTLAREAATSEARVTAPLRILTRLAHCLAEPDDCPNVYAEAVDLLCDTRGFDLACVARTAEDPADRHALAVLAQRGFPEWFFEDYRRLRPGVEFAVTIVQRTGEAAICEDVTSAGGIAPILAQGSALRLVRRAGIRAYAVLPLRTRNRVTGVLVAASRSPRAFSAQERLLLNGLADQLAVALAHAPSASASKGALTADQALHTVRRLLDTALAQRADPSPQKAALRLLCNLFQYESAACVAAAQGFDEAQDVPTEGPHLRALVQRAFQRDGVQRETWNATSGIVTALALRAPTLDGRVAAVGGIWYGDLADTSPHDALLKGLATACALAVHSR